MAPRKKLGNARRFKIFERDGFRCQYCGGTPPTVILQVDHIHPVAKGGTNEEENLVTACMRCNAGKRDRIIQQEAVPRDYPGMAEEAKEKVKQLREYRKHYAALRKEIDAAVDDVGEVFYGPGYTFNRSHADGLRKRNQVEYLIGLIGLDQVIDAARVTFAKFGGAGDTHDVYNAYRYFCGVCWRKADRMGIRAGKPPEDC